MTESLLYWSDNRSLYFAVAFGGALILVFLAVLPAFCGYEKGSLRSGLLFTTALGLWMLAARWPGLFYHRPFDPDEAQILAAAQTLGSQPVLYRIAECGSAGPLTVYFAGIPWIFGKVPSLIAARMIMVFFAWLGVAGIYVGLRNLGSELAARSGALVAGLFYGFTCYYYFVHYNSEMLPSVLCAWSTACLLYLLKWDRSENAPHWTTLACLAAFLLSMVPFAKLQLVPLGLCIGILIYCRGLWLCRGDWKQALGFTSRITLCVLAFPAAYFLLMYFGGVFDYFFRNYLLNNFVYTQSGYGSRILVAQKLVLIGDDMIPWSAAIIIITIIAFASGAAIRLKKNCPARSGALLCALLASVAFYCVLAPSRDYAHYLLLMPMPLAFAMGSSLAWFFSSEINANSGRIVGPLFAVLLITVLAPYFLMQFHSGKLWAGAAKTWSKAPSQDVVMELKKRTSAPSDGLLVWGHTPELHVMTGLLQASRSSVTSGSINQNAFTPSARKDLMEDLHNHSPRFIVDSVHKGGFMFEDSSQYGPQCFPEFNEFLDSHYKLIGTYSGMKVYEKELQ